MNTNQKKRSRRRKENASGTVLKWLKHLDKKEEKHEKDAV